MCCVVTILFSIEYSIEQDEVLPCPARSMDAGDHALSLYIVLKKKIDYTSFIWEIGQKGF